MILSYVRCLHRGLKEADEDGLDLDVHVLKSFPNFLFHYAGHELSTQLYGTSKRRSGVENCWNSAAAPRRVAIRVL